MEKSIVSKMTQRVLFIVDKILNYNDQNENQSPTIPQLKDKHLIFIIFPKYIYFW